MKNIKLNSMHILAFSYVFSVYFTIVLFYLISSPDIYWILFIPAIVAFISLIVLIKNRNDLDSTSLLDCTIIIKYGLVPFYLVGFFGIVTSLLLSLIPVPFMIIAGPATAILLTVIGYMVLLGSSVFSISYIVKAYKEQKFNLISMILSLISQFIFILDVLSVMILAFKENKYKKLSIGVIVLSICIIIFMFYS